jgi:hypothetical protein
LRAAFHLFLNEVVEQHQGEEGEAEALAFDTDDIDWLGGSLSIMPMPVFLLFLGDRS